MLGLDLSSGAVWDVTVVPVVVIVLGPLLWGIARRHFQ